MGEHIENHEYFKLYFNYKRANKIKTWLSMAGLIITLCNYQYHMTLILYKNSYYKHSQSVRNDFEETVNAYNEEVRWIVLGLSFGAIFFLSTWNKIKVDWTNNFYNKLLKKEVISD